MARLTMGPLARIRNRGPGAKTRCDGTHSLIHSPKVASKPLEATVSTRQTSIGGLTFAGPHQRRRTFHVAEPHGEPRDG
jgi:hypothetical protein